MVDHGRQKHLLTALFQDIGTGAGARNSGGFALVPAAVAAEAAPTLSAAGKSAALPAPAGSSSARVSHIS